MKFASFGSIFVGLLSLVDGATLPSPSIIKKTSVPRTSTPAGCLTVRKTGTLNGEYSTLTAALTALGTTSTAAACIFIYQGTFAEAAIRITYPGALTLYGYSANSGSYKDNTVTFTRNINSSYAGSLDASSVVNVVTSNFKAYNINFSNLFGAGAQAVALTANGNQQGYYGCGFYGYQDTLYAKSGTQYYSNCYIQGAVDYIFGDATAWFGECTIASNGGGAITANSRTLDTETTWYVIDSSTITAASGYSLVGSVYLGRPWRALARVIFQNSDLTSVVNAKGWTTLANPATPLFYEFGNTGAGAVTTARVTESSISAAVTKTQLFGSTYGNWIDETY